MYGILIVALSLYGMILRDGVWYATRVVLIVRVVFAIGVELYVSTALEIRSHQTRPNPKQRMNSTNVSPQLGSSDMTRGKIEAIDRPNSTAPIAAESRLSCKWSIARR